MNNVIARIATVAIILGAGLSASHVQAVKSVRHANAAFQVASATAHPDQADSAHGYPCG